jgi:hypothetical protein
LIPTTAGLSLLTTSPTALIHRNPRDCSLKVLNSKRSFV